MVRLWHGSRAREQSTGKQCARTEEKTAASMLPSSIIVDSKGPPAPLTPRAPLQKTSPHVLALRACVVVAASGLAAGQIVLSRIHLAGHCRRRQMRGARSHRRHSLRHRLGRGGGRLQHGGRKVCLMTPPERTSRVQASLATAQQKGEDLQHSWQSNLAPRAPLVGRQAGACQGRRLGTGLARPAPSPAP